MKTCRKGLHQYEPGLMKRYGCPECCKLQKVKDDRKRRTEHPEKIIEKDRKWREKNPDKQRETARKYFAKNPDKAKEKNSRRVEYMLDCYIKSLIPEVKNPPQELIEAKRIHLKLKRAIKEIRK